MSVLVAEAVEVWVGEGSEGVTLPVCVVVGDELPVVVHEEVNDAPLPLAVTVSDVSDPVNVEDGREGVGERVPVRERVSVMVSECVGAVRVWVRVGVGVGDVVYDSVAVPLSVGDEVRLGEEEELRVVDLVPAVRVDRDVVWLGEKELLPGEPVRERVDGVRVGEELSDPDRWLAVFI